MRFNKFLHNQSEVIRSVEQRRSNLTSTKVNKNKRNEYYSAVPTNDDDDVIDINVSIGSQSTQAQISNGNRNQYYQDRMSAVQGIEKTMNDLSSMFSRLSHIVYEQRSMIDK
jgi:t-SNARE complex subunit (syntaxin)